MHFTDYIKPDELGRFARMCAKNYDTITTFPNGEVLFDQRTNFQQLRESLGYRLASEDQTDLVIAKDNSFGVCRLAPYDSWESFVGRVERDWAVWRKQSGHRPLNRIGVRYINRIDVPVNDGADEFFPDRYVNLFVRLPAVEGYRIDTYSQSGLQVVGSLGQDECQYVVNSNVGPSPLINHKAILLDLDLSRSSNVPQRSDAVFSLLDRIRVHKNALFEAFITDLARELFDQ